MPIYEYRCASCGAELEKLQKISDPPLTECPECGKETLVKLVSASSFRLKGSGWYETDFKTGKKKNGAGEAAVESGGASGGGGAGDGGATADSSAPAAKGGEGATDAAKKEAPKSSDASATDTKKKPAPKA